MTKLTRRRFIALAGASGAAVSSVPLFAPRALGQAKAKLVVIGGGPGGGTVARYVNKETAGAVDVTLVEPQRNFTTCFFSNIYVGGFRDFKSLTHTYDKVRGEGVKIAHEMASAIDRDKREVVLASGQRLSYDRLVVAPGIDIKFELRAGLLGSRRRDDAACVEARGADRAPGAQAQRRQGRRHHRDGVPAQSLSLPAGPI